MGDDAVNYEKLPADMEMDETDVNFRAYLSMIPDEKLQEYDSNWTDDQVIAWDGNFRSDGGLMLICSERDVTISEYREVLVEHIGFRGLTPAG